MSVRCFQFFFQPFYTEAGEENRLNSLQERYEEAPNLYTMN